MDWYRIESWKAYERPAGHLGDKSVPCAPEAKCSYTLDVSGGWYDAGDHGKYVVNAGISVWTLLNQYERNKYFGSSASEARDVLGQVYEYFLGMFASAEKRAGEHDMSW